VKNAIEDVLRGGLALDLVRRSCIQIAADAEGLLKGALRKERSPGAKSMLETMLENVDLARTQRCPVCQSPRYPTI